MRHVRSTSRPASAALNQVLISKCPGDFCWQLEFVDGVLGTRFSGGFAGTSEWSPLFKQAG